MIDPLIAFLTGLVAVGAMVIVLDPNLPGRRPRPVSLALVGLIVGVVSGVILLGIEQFGPAKLWATAITLAVLGGVTASDVLRERMINAYLLLAGTAVVLVLSTIAGIATGNPANGVLGVVFTGGAGLLLFGGGLLFAHLRGAPDDEVTGSRIQDLGWGDVLVYTLLGALMGPVWGMVAFVIGIFAGAVLVLPVFVYDRLRGNEMMTRHVPMLPGITTGAVLVLLFIAVH